MKHGIGIGPDFGRSGNRLPRYVTDYFNGFELSGSTYSGGPVVTEDNTGALVTSPDGVLPMTGMRLATTVAEGATLGPELVPQPLDMTNATYWVAAALAVVLSANSYTTAASASNIRFILPLTKGKRYRAAVSGQGPIRLRNGATGGTLLVGSGSVEFQCSDIYQAQPGSTEIISTITNVTFSVREVIPTWLPTDLSGDPIHTSTPLRTRKGTVSKFAETYRGPLIEPARTNKVTCRKSEPVDTTNITKAGDAAAVLSVVDDTAALEAAGLSDICTSGMVYKLDNSAGTTDARANISGATGNINQHCPSCYIRITGREEKYPSLRISNGTPVPGYDTAVSTGYICKTIGYSEVSSSAILQVWATPGAIVYFILPQLEEGAFVTSPICKDSTGADPLTSLTRPAGNLTRPTAGTALESGNNFAIYGRVIPKAGGQGSHDLLTSYAAGTDIMLVGITDELIRINKYVGAASKQAAMDYVYSLGVPFDYLCYVHSTHGIGIAVRSWNGSVWSAWSTWATNPDTQDAPIASTYQIGARNNSNHFAGNYPFTEIIKIPASVEPQAWLMSQLAKGRI